MWSILSEENNKNINKSGNSCNATLTFLFSKEDIPTCQDLENSRKLKYFETAKIYCGIHFPHP